MDEKDLKKQLDEIGNSIDTKLESIVEAAKLEKEQGKEELTKVSKALKDEIAVMVSKYNETEKALTARMDEMEVAAKRLTAKDAKTSWADFIVKELSENPNFADFRNGSAKMATIDLTTKADDMTQANSFESTDVVGEMRVPGIIYDPDRVEHVRDILATGTTTQNAVGYVKEYAYTDATDVTTEGAEYKQGDFDLKLSTANVRKITNYIIISEEMLEDVQGLTSYILARLPSKIKIKEDYQLLYGHGTGINISGICTNAAAYVDNLADSTVTQIDVLADACRQVRVHEYKATYMVLHPTDVSAIRLLKDSTGRYIMPWVFSGAIPTIAGVPILESTMMTAGDFLVGDFQLGAQVFDRRQVAIEFSKESEDNFIKGMVTVRGSERLALAMYRDNAFVYGVFAMALASGSA